MNIQSAPCTSTRQGRQISLLISIMLTLVLTPTIASPADRANRAPADNPSAAPLTTDTFQLYLPIVQNLQSWESPFGIEAGARYTSGQTLLWTHRLDVGWVRMNRRISWRNLQPTESSAIQWHLLQDFEKELQGLNSVGVRPVVIIQDFPRWATEQPNSCSPLRPDKYQDFARFVQAITARYTRPPFGIHDWELGNEPDVAPELVPPDNLFGCWGDLDDPFYGGRAYGEMLKTVGAAIRAIDPTSRIWIGGLLLDKPLTTEPGLGRPELFLKGILEAGAAPYFDIVPYHLYLNFYNQALDYDTEPDRWRDLGGGVIGKAAFLRSIMAEYGVSKPLVLNEVAFACPNDSFSNQPWCQDPAPIFYELQASTLVRMFTRGLSADVKGFSWYTLMPPGWRHGNLLDSSLSPKPVYDAYETLIEQLWYSRFVQTVDYGVNLEAYAFHYYGPLRTVTTADGRTVYTTQTQTHVVWAKTYAQLQIVQVPASKFVAAYDQNGNQLTAALLEDSYYVPVGFNPVYIIREP